jgi:hypothetical protein
MNRDEAKFILGAYRPGGQDAGDPQFQEALEQLQHDPALAAWFAQEQALDARLSGSFRSFPVPQDLRSQLLAARQVIPLRTGWRWPARLAAAACLALTATLAAVWLRSPPPSHAADFPTYAAETIVNLSGLDMKSGDLTTVREWLQTQSAPSDFTLPAGLLGRPIIGCRLLEWNARKVSLVCFQLENGRVVHLFVTDRCSALGTSDCNHPAFAMMNAGIAVASWRDNHRLYVLASHNGEQDLKQLLRPKRDSGGSPEPFRQKPGV